LYWQGEQDDGCNHSRQTDESMHNRSSCCRFRYTAWQWALRWVNQRYVGQAIVQRWKGPLNLPYAI